MGLNLNYTPSRLVDITTLSNDAHNTFETDCYRAVGAWLHS